MTAIHPFPVVWGQDSLLLAIGKLRAVGGDGSTAKTVSRQREVSKVVKSRILQFGANRPS